MQATFAEIENEFEDITAEAALLAEAIARHLSARPEPASLAAWMDLHVFASATEKVYTGCERVMARIATLIDGAPLDRGEGWHIALLRRMANPYADNSPRGDLRGLPDRAQSPARLPPSRAEQLRAAPGPRYRAGTRPGGRSYAVAVSRCGSHPVRGIETHRQAGPNPLTPQGTCAICPIRT